MLLRKPLTEQGGLRRRNTQLNPPAFLQTQPGWPASRNILNNSNRGPHVASDTRQLPKRTTLTDRSGRAFTWASNAGITLPLKGDTMSAKIDCVIYLKSKLESEFTKLSTGKTPNILAAQEIQRLVLTAENYV
jgi:hypothetical protein